MAVDGNDVQKLEIRVRDLETWRSTLDAVNVERRAHDAEAFGRIHQRLDKIDGHISRMVWLIVAAIVGGVMTFILNGGLAGAS